VILPMNSIRLLLNRYGLRLFGIGFALFFYLRLDIGSIGAQIKNTDPVFFLLAVACVNAVVVLQAWRGYILLGEEKGKLSFRSYAHSYFVTMAASAVLPGRVGAVAQVPLLHQRGVRVGVAFANVLYDKLYDLAGFLSMGALFATILVSSGLTVKPELLIALSTITLVLIWYIDVFFSFAIGLIRRLFPSLIMGWSSFEATLSSLTKMYALFLTLVRLCGAVAVHWFGARAAGFTLPLVLLGAAAAFVALSTLIPVSVMGVGLREGIFLLLFAGRCLPEEQVLTFAFLLLLAYLSTVFIGTFLAIIARKRDVGTT